VLLVKERLSNAKMEKLIMKEFNAARRNEWVFSPIYEALCYRARAKSGEH
jgi:hypothetical protein